MKNVVYNGTANFQIFSSKDFEKAGLDQNKLTFERGVSKEVEDDVADALVSKEGIFGPYAFDLGETDEEPATKSSAKKSKPETDSGTTQLVDSSTSDEVAARGKSR